jgi:hypothetical protein
MVGSRLGMELGAAPDKALGIIEVFGNCVGLEVRHFFLHVAGQKNPTFLSEFGTSFLQRSKGFVDTQVRQSFFSLSLNRNRASSMQLNDGAKLRSVEGDTTR